jgi:hypothetical protein
VIRASRRIRALPAAFLALAAALVAPSPVHAFCRTMTEKAPADYDAVANGGCFDKGVPLFWRNSCVGYSIQGKASRKVAYEEASNLLSIAFTRWTGATCPTNGTGRSRASIDVRDLGPVECGKVEYARNGAANVNVVVFRDDEWTYGPQVLGLTTVSFDRETGELFGADMEINMVNMQPIALRDPVEGQAYDFLSVVTHEAGHFLGMGHSDQPDATMFARYDPPSTKMRILTDDDITGICTVYRPDGDRAVLDGKVTAAPQCDPTPRGGFTRTCEDAVASCATSAGGDARGGSLVVGAVAVALVTAGRRFRRRRATAAS